MAKIDVLPEIVRVREVFMENQTSYIVMDYVEGGDAKGMVTEKWHDEFYGLCKYAASADAELGRSA